MDKFDFREFVLLMKKMLRIKIIFETISRKYY